MPNQQQRLAIQAIDQIVNRQPAIRPVENTDLAQYILSHSFGGASKSDSADLASKQGAQSEGPSLLSKTFDLLSTGLYGTTNVVADLGRAIHDAPKNNPSANPLESIFQGIGAGGKSIAKNAVGSVARGAGDFLDIAGQVTGLDQAPVVGKMENKVESGLLGAADKLSPRRMGAENMGALGIKNPVAKYGLGFAEDVALDPITYVPGLDIINTIKKAKAAKRAAEGFRTAEDIAKSAEPSTTKLEDLAASGAQPGSNPASFDPSQFGPLRAKETGLPLTQPKFEFNPTADVATQNGLVPPVTHEMPSAALPPAISDKPSFLQHFFQGATDNPANVTDLKAAQRVDNAKRAANVRWGKPIDWHDIPEMSREEKAAFAEMGRQGKMAKKGIVSDGKGPISIPAVNNALEDVRNGVIPRFGPIPDGAVGDAADHAVQVAEKAASNLSKSTRKGIPTSVLTPADQVNLFNSTYNRAANLVNDSYAKRVAERAAKTPKFNNEQKAILSSIAEHNKSLGQPMNEADATKYIAQAQKDGYISERNAKGVLKHLFPKKSEPINNFASTRFGRQATETLARQMLKTAEDHLISKGIQPTYWNGMRVRLSDILQEVGAKNSLKHASEIMDAFMTKNTSKIIDPEVAQAVSEALARRSMATSDMLQTLSERTLQAKNDVLAKYKYPTPRAKQEMNAMPDQAAEVAKSMGATSVEAQAISTHVRTLIDSGRLPEQRLLDNLGPHTATALMEGRLPTEEIAKTSTLINKMLDQTPEQMMKDVSGNKVVDRFMALFSTWYGRPEEIKQIQQDVFMFAEDNAAYRTRFLRNLSKTYSRETLNRAFNLARQPEQLRLVSQGLESDPEVLHVASVYKDYFDWMLGSTGFDKAKDLGGVAAVRSSMVMGDVNKHLEAIGSKFRFIDHAKGKFKYHDPTGAEQFIARDYSKKGIGWMHSWENSNPVEYGQDPISTLHDIDLAMQRTVAEYATFDSFAAHFGAKVGDAHFDPAIHKAAIPHPRLAGYKFHPEIQKEMTRLIKDMETGAWAPKTPMMRTVIKGTRVWKSSVTIYRPVHHIRNVIGDAYNMWLAGHNNPLAFSKAIKVLETQKPRYAEALKSNNMDQLKSLIDSEALNKMSLFKKDIKSTDAIIKKGNVKIDSEQLWASGFKRGLFRGYNKIEDLFGETPMGAVFGTSPKNEVLKTLSAPFGGRAHAVATKVSEHREHFVRMAHYIAAVEKKVAKAKGDVTQEQLNKFFDEAAHEVRKYHPDGSDLTLFEQKARVVIPFYAWTRKEIPLLMQAMVQRPAKIVAYPRVQQAVAGASGIPINQDQGMLDPYPNDQLFPDWIRATGIGPIGNPQSDNPVARFWASFGATQAGLNGPEGYVSINPSNPFNDVTTQLFGFGDPASSMRGMVNSMNPALQIPMSLAFDKTFSGAPIQKANGGAGVTDYLLRQIPQIGEFSRITGTGRNDKAGVQGRTKQNVLNFLTGLGIQGSGPYQKSAEFEAKQRAKNASNSGK